MLHEIPVVDLFAGPGGLSEGFHRFQRWTGSPVKFSINLSIEKEPTAHRTLTLRAFLRQFPEGHAPEVYYRYVTAQSKQERASARAQMMSLPEWTQAEKEARLAELGGPDLPADELISWIRDAVGSAREWVLLGGPPCQAYSLIGRARRTGVGTVRGRKQIEALRKRREQDFFQLEMHGLYRQYISILAVMQPTAFIMENVKGILSSKDPSAVAQGNKTQRIFPRILEDLRDPVKALEGELGGRGKILKSSLMASPAGYDLYSFVVEGKVDNDRDFLIKSEDHGIPQRRHRVILLGVRKDVSVVPSILPRNNEKVAVEEVIEDLPRQLAAPTDMKDIASEVHRELKRLFSSKTRAHLEPGISAAIDRALDTRQHGLTRATIPSKLGADALAWVRDGRLDQPIQHDARPHMVSDLARYLFVAAYGQVHGRSPRLKDFPPALLPKHKNVKSGLKDGGTPSFNDRFKVQLKGRPATTVTSHIAKDGHYYIHYDVDQNRSLTVREAARIQTFPDNYFFEGSRSDQYRQVGNAVPPYLALKLAEVVAELIQRAANISKAA